MFLLLDPPDTLPAAKEFADVDQVKVQACFKAIDNLVSEGHRIPQSRMQPITEDGVVMQWLKAPQTGKIIYRLVCHLIVKGDTWEFYVALATGKKDQKMKATTRKTAARRIKDALSRGGP